MVYLITFSCYGTRLHGDPNGSVDRDHNIADTPFLDPDRTRNLKEQASLKLPLFFLDHGQRDCGLAAIRRLCEEKTWTLLAAHLRKTHVHVVLDAPIEPERVLNALKTGISRNLNRVFGRRDLRWTRHGSTRYLWTAEQIRDAIHYVTEKQGEPMAVYARGCER